MSSDKKPPRQAEAKTVGYGMTILIYEPVRHAGQGSDAPDLEAAHAAAFERAGIRETG